MSIKLKGSSDGSVSLDAPADTSPSGSDITLTLPTSAGSADQFLKNSGIAGELEYSSMVETSTGVGIGTSSPQSDLHVEDASATCSLSIVAGDSTSNSNIQFGDQDDINVGLISYNHTDNALSMRTSGSGTDVLIDSSGNLNLVSSSSTLTDLNFTASDLSVYARVEGGKSGSGVGDLRFHTYSGGLSERMMIRSDGYSHWSNNTTDSEYYNQSTAHMFHQGTNSRVVAILENSADSSPSGILIDFTDSSPDNNSSYYMKGQDSTTNRFYIWSDGDLDNHDGSYGSISDEKLKQDIVDAGSQWDDLKDLRVRKFKFKEDVAAYGDEAKTLIGLVAQEAEVVCPGLVKNNPDLDEEGNDLGTVTKSVRNSVLYMKAIKALQEAQTRIETLESQHADLLARVTALEAA